MEEKKVVFPQGQKKKQTTTVDPESGDYPMRTLWVRVKRTWVWDIRGRKVKVPFKLMYLNKVSLRHDKHFFRDLDGFFISFFSYRYSLEIKTNDPIFFLKLNCMGKFLWIVGF